ncbi:MAG: pyruvate dehydrogenase (acetyl-transferring), homodimeric type, partial [Pseudomonadota bacterium]
INEAGAMCDWIAAASSYSNHDLPMIPFYIFYSMFGFQRVGDLMWAAGDMQARGFLMGATAGRTTLAGEGLQHQDGHGHVLMGTIPNCVSYDPTFAYELAVIMRDGLYRMYERGENIYYYISVMNENYAHPAMPEGAEEGILRGLYKFRDQGAKEQVQLMGSGSILREAIKAADLLREDFGIEAGIWSATSFNELQRDGHEKTRWNLLHPGEAPRVTHVEACLQGAKGPVIAATDYVRAHADQIRAWIPQSRYVVLGTDGFGRSDRRSALRSHFEVDSRHIALAALSALVSEGVLKADVVAKAIASYGIDTEVDWSLNR